MVSVAEVAEARRLVAYDWLVTRSWNRLHYADLDYGQLADMYDDRQLWGSFQLACGRRAAYVSIPGYFTRMGAMRCVGCCQAMGYPAGKGSPKNDDACRRRLGLSTYEPDGSALPSPVHGPTNPNSGGNQ